MDLRIAFILALGLTGCTSQTAYLQNAQGEQGEQGEQVTCGPYFGTPVNYSFTFSLRNCVEYFQEAGFERVQGPQ